VGGYGIGRAASWVRDVWPDPVPALPANKVAAPEPADVGGPSDACTASSLTLTAVPSDVRTLPGQTISFDVTVTNSGRRPCLVDGSEASRQLVITDADGTTVWTSAHCSGEALELLLGPGDEYRRTLTWSGRSSAEGACTNGQAPVAPGDYTAQVVMADVPGATSEPVTVTVEDPAPPEPTPEPTPDPGADPSTEPDETGPA
jgi:hypothetical protein